MSLNGITMRVRPGVLPVSPPDYDEMPDEYVAQARSELLADNCWIADRIAEAADEGTAEMLMDGRVHDVCNYLLMRVNEAVAREVPDLAESLWQRDVEESHQAAAEYAADSRGDY